MLNTGLIINSRYRIVKLLGQGGFGAVYRAWDINLNQARALKINLDTSSEARRQFQREANTLAGLSHPNLPRVTDHFFVEGQGQFLVMDYVEGEDLEAILMREGQLAPEKAVSIITQIADALAYLHRQEPPIIHRDIKPANIRITADDHVFLVDFGLVKVYDHKLRTTIGARAVTPGYSPPEQYGQGNTDARTDVYALAATLYTMLTGDEPQESVQRIVEDKMQPVTQVNGAVSEPMSAALLQAMSLNPSQRYQSVDDFVHSLQQPNPTAKPENTAASQPPPIKENNLTVGTSQPSGSGIKPIWWVLGTAVLLLAVFFVFILPMTRQQAAQELALQITRQASGTRIAATSTAEYEGTETAVAEKITTRNDTIATLEAQATKVFGPSNGTLWHEENNLVKEVSAGVSLKNFIVWTKFTNPYSPDINSWDYGFVFRDDDSNKQFRLIIRSDQTWTLIQRKGDSSEFIASGSIPDLQVSANQRNKIKLIGHDNQGWLFVNDDFITELDLSSHTNSGDVLVATGMIINDEIVGAKTSYYDFAVWSLP